MEETILSMLASFIGQVGFPIFVAVYVRFVINNLNNYQEYEQLKVKLEENKEMLKILKGEDSIDR